jgi:hypothetical protein
MSSILYLVLVFFFDALCGYWFRGLFNRSYRLLIFLGRLIRIYHHQWTRLLLKGRLCIVAFVNELEFIMMFLSFANATYSIYYLSTWSIWNHNRNLTVHKDSTWLWLLKCFHGAR